MHKIGIICENGISAEKVEQEFWSKPDHYPEVYPHPKSFVEAYLKNRVDGLVMGLVHLLPKHLLPVGKIKERQTFMPMAILFEKSSQKAKQCLSLYQNLALLSYPGEMSHLNGVFSKMFSQEVVRCREHTRYKTDLKTVAAKGEQRFGGRIVNISKQGAGCYFYGEEFKKGDLVKLDIPLQGVARRHEVKASVMWTAPPELAQDGAGGYYQQVGLRFAS